MNVARHFPTNLASPLGQDHHDAIDTRAIATISQRRRRFGRGVIGR
jgi:hypothetical protein